MALQELTTAPAFQEWKVDFRNKVREAAGSKFEKAWTWILEVEKEDATIDGLADSGKFPILDNALSTAISKAAAKLSVGHDIRLKEEELRKLDPPQFLKGRQKTLMVYKFFRTEAARGFMYGYQDMLSLRCKGEADLERYHKRFKEVRTRLTTDIDEKLIQLMYYENVKSLPCLRETVYHYDLEDEGSPGKTLSVLTAAVDKHLDKQLRARNREAELRAAGPSSQVPGMAAEPRPRRRS